MYQLNISIPFPDGFPREPGPTAELVIGRVCQILAEGGHSNPLAVAQTIVKLSGPAQKIIDDARTWTVPLDVLDERFLAPGDIQ